MVSVSVLLVVALTSLKVSFDSRSDACFLLRWKRFKSWIRDIVASRKRSNRISIPPIPIIRERPRILNEG
jgi:hypothetical protein